MAILMAQHSVTRAVILSIVIDVVESYLDPHDGMTPMTERHPVYSGEEQPTTKGAAKLTEEMPCYLAQHLFLGVVAHRIPFGSGCKSSCRFR